MRSASKVIAFKDCEITITHFFSNRKLSLESRWVVKNLVNKIVFLAAEQITTECTTIAERSILARSALSNSSTAVRFSNDSNGSHLSNAVSILFFLSFH